MTLVEREPSTTGYDGTDPGLLRLHELMAGGMSQSAASRRLWGPPPAAEPVEPPEAITPRRRGLRLTRWERG